MRAQDGASLTAVQWAHLRRQMPPHRTKLRMLSATCVPQVAPCWTLHRHHAFGKVRHVIVGITPLFCQKSYRQGVPGLACGGRRPISLANFQPAREVRLPLLSGTFSISGQKLVDPQHFLLALFGPALPTSLARPRHKPAWGTQENH